MVYYSTLDIGFSVLVYCYCRRLSKSWSSEGIRCTVGSIIWVLMWGCSGEFSHNDLSRRNLLCCSHYLSVWTCPNTYSTTHGLAVKSAGPVTERSLVWIPEQVRWENQLFFLWARHCSPGRWLRRPPAHICFRGVGLNADDSVCFNAFICATD